MEGTIPYVRKFIGGVRLQPDPTNFSQHDKRDEPQRVADDSARQPRRDTRVLRLRHLRHLRAANRTRRISQPGSARLAHGHLYDLRHRVLRTANWWSRARPARRQVRTTRRFPRVDLYYFRGPPRPRHGAALR